MSWDFEARITKMLFFFQIKELHWEFEERGPLKWIFVFLNERDRKLSTILYHFYKILINLKLYDMMIYPFW